MTSQPFFPKLRLTNQMRVNARGTCFLIFLVGAFFLAAQFHYCTDLMVDPSASHICSACSTMDSLVAAPVPQLAIAHVNHRLEIVPSVRTIFLAAPRTASLRAPPSL